MKAKRIANTPLWSWKVRFATFAGIFGVIWLFVEPLFSLLGSVSLNTLGIWGYLGLVVVSVVATAMLEYRNKMQFTGKIDFTQLAVILTGDGTRHLVEGPSNMLVGVFVGLLLNRLSVDASPDSLITRHDMYEVLLFVKRPSGWVAVPNDKTVREAGLSDGDECRLHGKIRKGLDIPAFLRRR